MPGVLLPLLPSVLFRAPFPSLHPNFKECLEPISPVIFGRPASYLPLLNCDALPPLALKKAPLKLIISQLVFFHKFFGFSVPGN